MKPIKPYLSIKLHTSRASKGLHVCVHLETHASVTTGNSQDLRHAWLNLHLRHLNLGQVEARELVWEPKDRGIPS